MTIGKRMFGQFIFSVVLLSTLAFVLYAPSGESYRDWKLGKWTRVANPWASALHSPSSAVPDIDRRYDGHFIECILLSIYVAWAGFRFLGGYHGSHLHRHTQYVHGHALHPSPSRDQWVQSNYVHRRTRRRYNIKMLIDPFRRQWIPARHRKALGTVQGLTYGYCLSIDGWECVRKVRASV